MTEINEALRGHVTRVGFDLSLGRTHVAALVELDYALKRGEWVTHNFAGSPFRHAFRNDVTGRRGLEDRGLIERNAFAERRKGEMRIPIRRVFKITRAGRLVINLLKESGIYQEYAAALPMPRSEAVA